MFGKRVALFTLLTVVAQVNPAHAITFSFERGTNIDPNTSRADGGTFTTQRYTNTVDFNSGNTTNSLGLTFTGLTGTVGTTTQGGSGNRIEDKTTYGDYAPPYQTNPNVPPPYYANQPGTTTTSNPSKFLIVDGANPVTITSNKLLNYMGLDWGYADSNNSISFYNTTTTTPNTAIATFTASQIFGTDQSDPANQRAAYIDFTSTDTARGSDFFNQIVLNEANPGQTGFETDNYSVRVAPAPSQVSGILALGAMGAWNLRRGNRKPKQVVTK